MPKSQSDAPQMDTVAQKLQVRFATNRVQTGGDELFGSDFRKGPTLFVTGRIEVYHQGGSQNRIGFQI